MNFIFKVNLNDSDYLDCNVFWMLRSHYGKKQVKGFRTLITIMFLIFGVIFLIGRKFTAEAFLGLLPMLILFFIVQMCLSRILTWSIKLTVKNLKKSGKMGYSPESVMEFHEDSFSETTPDNKTEQKYSAIERISIVDNSAIYIHVNNVMLYILPRSCFESKEQYAAFLAFIKTKCANIDVY